MIDQILVADLDAPRKQRHTVTRIFARLVDEHAMTDISYPVVRAYVAKRKPEIRVEQGRGEPGGFVPQTHLPGREAEVDFSEVAIRLRGELVTVHLFSLRMSYSGKAVHQVSATGGQEAFFEGHAHAFAVLGGVPAGKIRYDNLKAAVAQAIGFSRQRVEADRWVAFRSHFDIDAVYCQPGIKGASADPAPQALVADQVTGGHRPPPARVVPHPRIRAERAHREPGCHQVGPGSRQRRHNVLALAGRVSQLHLASRRPVHAPRVHPRDKKPRQRHAHDKNSERQRQLAREPTVPV
ncbi:MAG: hypothetical protein L0H96_05145 [Humibacillus sp.]|nr:hypothetical protein [Humibacillus sp.]MDN5776274.1 hypothetical protein [Humibacillus sp.]